MNVDIAVLVGFFNNITEPKIENLYIFANKGIKVFISFIELHWLYFSLLHYSGCCDITDEEAKEAVKDAGIGTPATRAAIIATLFKRDYIERSGKSIRPTEKGLYLFEAVKDMQVADVEMTGCWEKALAQIEGHTLDTETFMRSIRDYTHKAIGEILRLEFPPPKSRSFTCPKCKCGHVIIRGKAAKCDKEGCGLMVFRRFLNKELTDQHLEQLFSSGSTRLIKGFKGKKGVSFDAMVAFDESFNLKLVFPKPKGGKGK